MTVRVVLADDHELIRRGIAAVVESLDDVELVAECVDLPSLMGAVDEHAPDVVVTDIRMPPTGTDEGIEAARTIRASHPEVGVVVLSQFAEPDYVLELFDDGCERRGYLLKDKVSRSELERAVHAVSTGGSSVDPTVVELLVAGRRGGDGPIDRLTPREREVLACIAEGRNNAAVAQALVLSEKAVAKHINSIFSKLSLGEDTESHSRVKAVLMWLAAA